MMQWDLRLQETQTGLQHDSSKFARGEGAYPRTLVLSNHPLKPDSHVPYNDIKKRLVFFSLYRYVHVITFLLCCYDVMFTLET